MKPSKMFQEFEAPKRRINNSPRPSPLTNNKASHLVQKPNVSSLSTVQKLKAKAQHSQPVIIYTHSPEIIHAEARDFMALVQRLTGISQSGDRNVQGESHNESTSIVTDEKSSKVSQMCKMPNASSADFPLFAPSSSNIFKYSDGVVFPSPSIMASPSFVEFLKSQPEY